ncbi:MAG: hypothetical protein GXP25_17595 [Planctomycetes bacterium]|nr:hypothetical protein [Planctomycetota bacterium]
MKKLVGLIAMMCVLGLAIGVLAQDEGGAKEHKGKKKREHRQKAGKGKMSPGLMIRALKEVSADLSEEQREKIEEARAKMLEAMKAAGEEFESALSGILTEEQKQQYEEAKKSIIDQLKKRRGGKQRDTDRPRKHRKKKDEDAEE